MGALNRIIVPFGIIFIALNTWGAADPSHYNWGFHYFGFLGPILRILSLVVALSILIPQIRNVLLAGLSIVVRFMARRSWVAIFISLLIVWVGLILLFPEKLHLLGDSGLIIRWTPRLPSIENLNDNFRNQPLTYQTLRLIQRLIGFGHVVEPIYLYRVTDLLAGILFVVLIFYFLRKLGHTPLETTLVGALLFFQVQNSYFFGYVENYMFFYVAVCAFLAFGWLSLERKLPVWIPALILLLTPAFHIIGMLFLPMLVPLLLPYWKSHRKYFLYVMAGIIVITTSGLLVWGIPFIVYQRIPDALRYDILPLFTPPWEVPYGIISVPHMIDWGNAYLHAAPFALVCIVAGMTLVPRKEYLKDGVFRFLATGSIVGFLATLTLLPGLGMARDWDMFSVLFVPLYFLMLYFLLLLLRNKENRHAVVLVTTLTMIRWVGWIGLNANEESHLARAESLIVPALSGTFPTVYYEHLGSMFYKRGDYSKAVKFYEMYLSKDSTQPRILANLSDSYRGLGDRENRFRLLRLSVAANSQNPGVYSNLALEYADRGDTTLAISLLNRLLKERPDFTIAHANLSVLKMGRHQYREALVHADEAIRLGMSDPLIIKTAGYACYNLSDYPGAVRYLNLYLQSVPSDAKAKALVEKLQRRPDASGQARP